MKVTKTMPRRHFLTMAAATAGAVIAKPSIINAQSLSHNDIWTKQPKETLKSAVSLCFDISSSMKADEPYIQREGTAAAISHPSIRYIVNTPNHYTGHRGIAVCAVTFNSTARVIGPDRPISYLASNRDREELKGCWAILENDDDIDQFRSFIMNKIPVQTVGGTNIIAALEQSHAMHHSLPYESAKKVCDISGDGAQSYYHTTPSDSYVNSRTRYAHMLKGKSTQLSQAGIMINCFAMTARQEKPGPIEMNNQMIDMDLRTYYETFLQSPPEIEALDYQGGFTIDVSKGRNLREAYPIGMTRKMSREFF